MASLVLPPGPLHPTQIGDDVLDVEFDGVPENEADRINQDVDGRARNFRIGQKPAAGRKLRICAELEISDNQYVAWLRLLFMLLCE